MYRLSFFAMVSLMAIMGSDTVSSTKLEIQSAEISDAHSIDTNLFAEMEAQAPYAFKYPRVKDKVDVDTHRGLNANQVAYEVEQGIKTRKKVIIDAGASGGIHANLKIKLDALKAAGKIKSFNWPPAEHPNYPKPSGQSFVTCRKNS